MTDTEKTPNKGTKALTDLLAGASAIKEAPPAALDHLKRAVLAPVLGSSLDLDAAKVMAGTRHGRTLAAALDQLTPAESLTLGRRWLSSEARKMSHKERIAALRHGMGVRAPKGSMTVADGVNLALDLSKHDMSDRSLRESLASLISAVGETLAQFGQEEARKLNAGPLGEVFRHAPHSVMTAAQLKQMAGNFGLRVGRTESHTTLAERVLSAITTEPTSGEVSSPEPTPEPAPKKRGGRKAGGDASGSRWEPVQNPKAKSPGPGLVRMVEIRPDGSKGRYEWRPIQKADERRGAYLMRVLRWHLDQMREVV